MITAATIGTDYFKNGIKKFLVEANTAIDQSAEQAVDNVHGYNG